VIATALRWSGVAFGAILDPFPLVKQVRAAPGAHLNTAATTCQGSVSHCLGVLSLFTTVELLPAIVAFPSRFADRSVPHRHLVEARWPCAYPWRAATRITVQASIAHAECLPTVLRHLCTCLAPPPSFHV
jgi:hypothetical protein